MQWVMPTLAECSKIGQTQRRLAWSLNKDTCFGGIPFSFFLIEERHEKLPGAMEMVYILF